MFLFPITAQDLIQSSKGTLNGLVVLNYQALHGNGEEEIWWEKKKTWKIVANDEYKEIISKYLAYENNR